MKPTLFARATAVAAVVFVTSLVASPAQAVPHPFPDADDMFAIACDTSVAPLQVYSTEPSTGIGTEVGAGSPDVTGACAYHTAWDASTSTAYVLFEFVDFSLGAVDLVTGVTTTVAPITFADAPFALDSIAIDLDGNAYGVAFQQGDGLSLFDLDLVTGVASNPRVLPGITEPVFAFGVNPVSGELFAIEQDSFEVHSIDAVADTSELRATLEVDGVDQVLNLQFDSAGTLWFTTFTYASSDTSLFSAVQEDFASTDEFSGVTRVIVGEAIENPVNVVIIVVPAAVIPGDPELPDTGTDSAGLIALASLLTVAGAVLLIARRRVVRA